MDGINSVIKNDYIEIIVNFNTHKISLEDIETIINKLS